MGNIGWVQLLIVLAIIILVFGTKKLRNIGGDLGNAVKGFKKAVADDDQTSQPEQLKDNSQQQAQTAEEKQKDKV